MNHHVTILCFGFGVLVAAACAVSSEADEVAGGPEPTSPLPAEGSPSTDAGRPPAASGGASSSGGGAPTDGGAPNVPRAFPACADLSPFDAGAIDDVVGPYRGPGSAREACTQAEVATLAANSQTAITSAELVQGLSPACRDCVLTPTAAPRWGVFIEGQSSGSPYLDVNPASCFALVSGSNACGKAYYYLRLCRFKMCAPCYEADPSDPTGCTDAAKSPGSPCEAAYDAVTAACPQFATNAAACDSLAEITNVVCGQ